MDLFILISKLHNKYIYLLHTPLNKLKLRMNHAKYGTGLKVRGSIYIFRHYESTKLQIGNNVSINSAGWANPIGSGDRTYFLMMANSEIIIGDGCGISNCALSCACKIVLQNNVMLGSGCRIYDTDFHALEYAERIRGNYLGAPINKAPIFIEEGVFVGALCVRIVVGAP